MRHIFDIERTIRTYGIYFEQHREVLRELLRSVARGLDRCLPADVSARIDREGSTIRRDEAGRLAVVRHPDLSAAVDELARLGLFRSFAPEEFGGFDLPVGIYYLAVNLVSYYDTSLALVLLVHGNAMYIIERYGTTEQRGRYLPSLAAGAQLATVAFTEPRAGSDAGSIRTTATREGDSYVLKGDKLFITNGGDADLLVTTARTGPLSDGVHGVSTFILEREADGVEILGLEDKTALNGSPTAALSYPGIRIPADRLLGRPNHGGEVMFAGVGMTRVNIGAQALGIAKRAFDAAVDFAREREQGGRIILQHDAIQQRLSRMAQTISAMENLICHVARLEDRGEWHVREMSITKYFCSEALQTLTTRAINVFGGYGVSRSYVVERCRREAVTLPLYGGTSEIQWFIIAREYLDCLSGKTRVDYRRRDAEIARRLIAACPPGEVELARRVGSAQDSLWDLAAAVARLEDAIPFHRHIADLATACSAAAVLVEQAARDPAAGRLEWRLAAMAVDRLEDQEAASRRRVEGRIDRADLKGALLRQLDRK